MLSGIEKAAFAALPMYEVELNEIVDAWIAGWQAERGSPEYEKNWWAHSQFMDWALQADGDRLWQFVVEAYKRSSQTK